jgi:hypothetical protein
VVLAAEGPGITIFRILKKTIKEIGVEQAKLEYPPLTFEELNDLLSRHIENASIAKVIKDAIQRRLSDAWEAQLR